MRGEGDSPTGAAWFGRGRALLGVLAKDVGRYRRALADPGDSYLALCNRDETLDAAPHGIGYRCTWQWTSDLHAPKVLPALGARLMQRSLTDYPVRRAATPSNVKDSPDICFVIGHRGVDRLPLLLATLESIAGQRNASIECIVVEQDVEPRIAARLPGWVRHVHSPPPAADMPYCRSWAFNVGVKSGNADVLVLHDNDMLVPADYAARILRHVQDGYQVVNLKRFVFYLGENHTERVCRSGAAVGNEPALAIVQNLEAGGSVAITRDAYAGIGGMDESFVGWGGEDNEFWERAQTQRVWPYAYMPIVHLWHAPQPEKHRSASSSAVRYRELSALPAAARIAHLVAAASGERAGPAGWNR
jgi:hypothetical protein